MQYCSLQHQTCFYHQYIHNWVLFLLWLHPFILSGVISPLISSSILGPYRPRKFIFQCPVFLRFHTVHGVLKARILKWFAIPFSSGPHSVRPLHHDPSVLGGPTGHGLVALSQTGCFPCEQIVVSVIVVSVCLPSDALSRSLPSYLGFSYLGRGMSLHGRSSKAQPLLLALDVGQLRSGTAAAAAPATLSDLIQRSKCTRHC